VQHLGVEIDDPIAPKPFEQPQGVETGAFAFREQEERAVAAVGGKDRDRSRCQQRRRSSEAPSTTACAEARNGGAERALAVPRGGRAWSDAA
jgi:hypothetical protein